MGRVHRYVMDTYGATGFTKDGAIKDDYLEKAIARAKEEGEASLEKALNEAKTLKELSKEREALA